MGVLSSTLWLEVSSPGAMRTRCVIVLLLTTALIVQSPALVTDRPRLVC